MRRSARVAALASAITALAVAVPALAHQTSVSRGVAVTVHVLPDDEPVAGQPATIVAVNVRPPRGGRFAFRTCTCRVRVRTAAGTVVLNRRTGKRTPFTFPQAGAYQITYSGTYRSKRGTTRSFAAGFAIRAS
jgi:hypothetical protein